MAIVGWTKNISKKRLTKLATFKDYSNRYWTLDPYGLSYLSQLVGMEKSGSSSHKVTRRILSIVAKYGPITIPDVREKLRRWYDIDDPDVYAEVQESLNFLVREQLMEPPGERISIDRALLSKTREDYLYKGKEWEAFGERKSMQLGGPETLPPFDVQKVDYMTVLGPTGLIDSIREDLGEDELREKWYRDWSEN